MSGSGPIVADTGCAFTSPHFLATQAGMEVLERGGNAIDAMVSAAAMIAAVHGPKEANSFIWVTGPS